MSSHSARRPRRPATLLTWVFAATCAWVVGCVYDADDRCSPGQVVVKYDRCACAPGFVAIEGVCTPCPEHELEQNGICVCEEGYTRSSEGAACTLDAPGLGDACADDGDCTEERFPHCQADAAGDYCTDLDCASTEDCSGGYACDLEATPSYCKRPPLGQSAPCATQDDCSGFEASYCEQIEGHVCLVPGCDTDPDVECFIGWECCHAGEGFGLPTLCVPEGTCPQ
jgi:hypothetical protein